MKLNQTKNLILLGSTVLSFLFFTACGSLDIPLDDSGDSGSGEKAHIQGTVPSSSVANLMKAAKKSGTDEPESDSEDEASGSITVYALDAGGNRTETQTDGEGNFDLALTVGLSYIVGFSDGTHFLGVLTFAIDASGEYTSTHIYLSSSAGVINLGIITFVGGVAYPEHNPLEELDEDSDGTSDLEDEDCEYKWDEEYEGEEEECVCITDEECSDEDEDYDEDGDVDDEDEEIGEDCCCGDDEEDEDMEPFGVLRTSPRNGEMSFPVDRRLRVRFSRELDPASVDENSLILSDGWSFAYGSTDITDEGQTLVLTPDHILASETIYALRISPEIADVEGNTLGEEVLVLFMTAYDDWYLDEEGEFPWEEEDEDGDGDLDITVEIWIEIYGMSVL